MAATTMPAYRSSFDSKSFISSPLASSSSRKSMQSRPQPARTPSFPPSRPLRPFASIAHSAVPMKSGSKSTSGRKPVKLIEPPKNHKATFLLNLTQAEFSRQD